MTTFRINNTVPDNVNYIDNYKEYLENIKTIKKSKGMILINTTPENSIITTKENGFIGALISSYCRHLNLVLRPDDVWLAIINAFTDYIDSNAEKMRKLFVKHEDQMELNILRDENESWFNIISKLSDKISENISDDIKKWMEPDFTTTTDNDLFISRIMLMRSMKNYFKYSCFTQCGIPEVTLKGDLQDWINIRTKIEKLKTYREKDLELWYDVLVPVLDQFIESYKGNVDINFWNTIYHDHNHGSGTSDFSGWLLVFIPFKKGKYMLNPNPEINGYGDYSSGNIPSGCVSVPIKYNSQDLIIYAGFIVSVYNKDLNEVKPSLDWCLLKMEKSFSIVEVIERISNITTDEERIELINYINKTHDAVKLLKMLHDLLNK